MIDDLSDYGKGVADAAPDAVCRSSGVTVQRIGVDAQDHRLRRRRRTHGRRSRVPRRSSTAATTRRPASSPRRCTTAGYKGDKYTGNGGKSSVFVDGAGAAGEGWYFTCGCSDATVAPAAKDFTAAYQATFNTDAVDVLAGGLRRRQRHDRRDQDRGQGRHPDPRQSVENAVNNLDYKGITTRDQVRQDRRGRPPGRRSSTCSRRRAARSSCSATSRTRADHRQLVLPLDLILTVGGAGRVRGPVPPLRLAAPSTCGAVALAPSPSGCGRCPAARRRERRSSLSDFLNYLIARDHARVDVRAHRARLHARLRRPAADQLRAQRGVHVRGLRQLPRRPGRRRRRQRTCPARWRSS